MKDDVLSIFLTRVEKLLARAELLLPQEPMSIDWRITHAARWKRKNGRGALYAVAKPHTLSLDNLVAIDEQKARVDQNTKQFVGGYAANNVLLTGAPGTGKSSLVKAMLGHYAKQGLRLIEVDKHDLFDLPDILSGIEGLPQRFIVFCDDLAFDAQEGGYRELKAVLDGSIMSPPDNVLIYATSNRRHLMPTYFHENFVYDGDKSEIRPDEAKDEKVSLAERFGLWVSFYTFSEDEYLDAVMNWLNDFGVVMPKSAKAVEELRFRALRWARMRGAVSGRVAWQFARDYVGSMMIMRRRGGKR
ncbi:MAG: ATP-binding protein [Burkholderiales bacterium]|jgi:predicted AAA+ superfamily ATPase|nr:ATP-binding protein [Burkholderiales bacterium]